MIVVGLLIDGVEFIPQSVVEGHLPFAVPPGVTVQVVYALATENDA